MRRSSLEIVQTVAKREWGSDPQMEGGGISDSGKALLFALACWMSHVWDIPTDIIILKNFLDKISLEAQQEINREI